METKRYNIWKEGEYLYSAAFGFQPNMRSYLHEDEDVRPCILVIPGGGYRVVSPTEGEIVAKRFYEKGYQVFVGSYTTNPVQLEALKMQPLHDISRMVRFIRKHASEFHLDPEKLVVCGFSAGAHLCGSLCVHGREIKDEDAEYAELSNRPDGAILSYPVITSGTYAHRDSFVALLGEDASEEELDYMSLEKQVHDQVPPMFLWQTVTDEAVPVENSYLMAKALKQAGISFEHHVFPKGRHGLSLADEVWASGQYGERYTEEQAVKTSEAVKRGEITISRQEEEALAVFAGEKEQQGGDSETREVVPEVTVWPELADAWIRTEIAGRK